MRARSSQRAGMYICTAYESSAAAAPPHLFALIHFIQPARSPSLLSPSLYPSVNILYASASSPSARPARHSRVRKTTSVSTYY